MSPLRAGEWGGGGGGWGVGRGFLRGQCEQISWQGNGWTKAAGGVGRDALDNLWGGMLHEGQLKLAKGGFTLHLLMASSARLSTPINEKLSYGLMPYTSKGSEKWKKAKGMTTKYSWLDWAACRFGRIYNKPSGKNIKGNVLEPHHGPALKYLSHPIASQRRTHQKILWMIYINIEANVCMYFAIRKCMVKPFCGKFKPPENEEKCALNSGFNVLLSRVFPPADFTAISPSLEIEVSFLIKCHGGKLKYVRKMILHVSEKDWSLLLNVKHGVKCLPKGSVLHSLRHAPHDDKRIPFLQVIILSPPDG